MKKFIAVCVLLGFGAAVQFPTGAAGALPEEPAFEDTVLLEEFALDLPPFEDTVIEELVQDGPTFEAVAVEDAGL